ncbi:MAG: response regulator [Spirochaetes bacterium]|nr:response regulator [Spirochaetota bacterium]
MEKVHRYTGKILVVDDEEVNVDFFQLMLGKLGFGVTVAYNGEEALERLKESRPDIILLDLVMPKINGFELTEILKANEETRDIPIIILSAIDDIREKVDMLELGIEDYITKPFNFIEVLARIRSILRSKDLREDILKNERKLSEVKILEGGLTKFMGEMSAYIDEITACCRKKQTGRVEELLRKMSRSVENLESDFKAYISKIGMIDEKKRPASAFEGADE